ncbi:cholecystokinin receptor type A-like [Ornithodoros turicata]
MNDNPPRPASDAHYHDQPTSPKLLHQYALRNLIPIIPHRNNFTMVVPDLFGNFPTPSLEVTSEDAITTNVTLSLVTSWVTSVANESNVTYDNLTDTTAIATPEDFVLRVTLYAIIFFFAVVGNALVMVTLVQNKRMRTVTNVFLINLAVSDLLLGVFCMPFTLIGSLLRNFVFGEIMCKCIPYLQAVSVSVSVWTLVSISLERFFAIVRPLQSRRWQTISHAYRVIGAVWAFSLLHMAPIAMLSKLIPIKAAGHHKCREVWPSDRSEKGFNLYLDTILLVIPLIIMVVVYALITRTLCMGIRFENRSATFGVPMKVIYTEKRGSQSNGVQCVLARTTTPPSNGRPAPMIIRGSNPEKNQAAIVRVIRMLFVVVIEFFVCWTPLYVVNTWSLYDPDNLYEFLGSTGVSVIHLLAYASSCSNPITYCFMHHKFRQGFLTAVGCRRHWCGRLTSRWSSDRRNYASTATLSYRGSVRKSGRDFNSI